MNSVVSMPKDMTSLSEFQRDIPQENSRVFTDQGSGSNNRKDISRIQASQSMAFLSRTDLTQKDDQQLDNPYEYTQQKKFQVRQFTLGNEQSEHFGSPQLNSSVLRQLNSSTSHQNLIRSLPQISQSNETESLKRICLELQARVSRLEDRASANEEKQELQERLQNLKAAKVVEPVYSPSQIKQEIETSVRNILATQSISEGDRIIDCLRSIDQFQQRLMHSEQVFIRVSKDIEQRFQEEISLQSAQIERVLFEVRQRTQGIEKTNEKFLLFSKQNSDILEKIVTISQDFDVFRDDHHKNLQKTKQQIELLEKEQTQSKQEVSEILLPTINSLEDDMLRILKGQKEITDISHITKYLDDEVVQLKHKIKIIMQTVQVQETRYSSTESVAQFRLINK